MNLCQSCAGHCKPRCPFQKVAIPEEIQQYGCALYIHQPKPFNAVGAKTKCSLCRYLFRKKKSEMADRSFIVCGAIPSQVQRITPIPCCPNFKPLRRKQMQKRLARAAKQSQDNQRPQNGPQNQSFFNGRQNRSDVPYVPRDNKRLSGSIYAADPSFGREQENGGYQRRQGGYNDRGYNNRQYPPRRGNNGYNN